MLQPFFTGRVHDHNRFELCDVRFRLFHAADQSAGLFFGIAPENIVNSGYRQIEIFDQAVINPLARV